MIVSGAQRLKRLMAREIRFEREAASARRIAHVDIAPQRARSANDRILSSLHQ